MKKNYNPALPSLFADWERQQDELEAQRKAEEIRRQKRETEKREWAKTCDEVLNWLFDDAGYRERQAAQRSTCPGKIISVVTIDQ